MSARDYPRLGVVEFGRAAIESRDLDPVYDALCATAWDRDTMARWLLAYWCFYDVGTACWIAQRPLGMFWPAMRVAARNEQPAPTGGRWPRAPERRHFRGDKCVAAVDWMAERRVDHDLIASSSTRLTIPFRKMFDAIRAWPQFGPWIAFKATDMLDRVWGLPVEWKLEDVLMYDTPREAALILARDIDATDAAKVEHITRWLQQEFEGLPPPGLKNRVLGLPEVETVLCKWKSHVNGHYPLGHDSRDLALRIEPWLPHCGLAEEFRDALRRALS